MHKNTKPSSLKIQGFIYFIISASLFFSCSEETVEIQPDLLLGGWNLEKVEIDDLDGTKINDWVSSAALYFDKDQSYYRNYVGGEWTVSGDKLILDPTEGLEQFYRESKILLLSDNTLKVRMNLTESQYCCDFEQFGDDEILTITETYTRAPVFD